MISDSILETLANDQIEWLTGADGCEQYPAAMVLCGRVIKMLEFVLFHQKPLSMFEDFLRQSGVEFQAAASEADEGVYEIRIPENIPDDLLEKIEERYEQLMDYNQELYYEENPASEENFRVASLVLELKDGGQAQAHFAPALISAIVDAIGYEKLHEFTQAIVRAVEDPDARTFCQKVRAGEIDFDGGK